MIIALINLVCFSVLVYIIYKNYKVQKELQKTYEERKKLIDKSISRLKIEKNL